MAGADSVDVMIRLGCPFGCRNPELYKKCRACNGAGFTELSQVKDHLKRVHPSQCPLCSFVFGSNPTEEHTRQQPDCKYRPKDSVEYMTEGQSQELKKMPKRCRNTSPGDQWRVIYTKLFGDSVPIPPPYLPSLEQYRRIAETPSPELVSALQDEVHVSGHRVEESLLRFCLGVVLPKFFNLVSEQGPGSSTWMSVPQLLHQFGVPCPEHDPGGSATDDNFDLHSDTEDILNLFQL